MTLRDILDLFGVSIAASLIAAPVLALCGSLLHLRREAFLGVAAPQFASAGVALALWMLPLFPGVQEFFLEHGHPPMFYLLPFAAGSAVAALLLYGLRSSRAGAGGQALAGSFALAGALSMIFLSHAPSGANFAETMLRGEVLLLDVHDFTALSAVSVLAVVFLIRWRRALIVDAVDPEQALALRLPSNAMRKALPVVLGIVVGCGVMTLGPILVFSLLFLPPLAAHGFARGLRGSLLASLLISISVAAAAWPLAIGFDLPYGPAAGLLAGASWAASGLWSMLRGQR